MPLGGLDQHVAENRHGGAGGDNIENLLEAVGKMILVDLKFHGEFVRFFRLTGNAYVRVLFIYINLFITVSGVGKEKNSSTPCGQAIYSRFYQ
jgi:hypothetical protein